MLTHALMDVMLLAGSPLLEDLGARPDLFVALRSRELNNARRHGVEQLARTLVEMGVLGELPFEAQPSREEWLARSQAGEIDVPKVWLDWTRRWFETSTLSRSSRTHTYYALIKAGRWLHREHPDRTDPASWDRQLVAAWIAAVDGLRVGELSKSLNANYMRARLRRAAVAALQGAADLVAADVLPRPAGMGVDRAAVRPAPRVRAAAVDQGADRSRPARDLRRGMGEADVGRPEPRPRRTFPRHGQPGGNGTPWYPLELVRAVALLWLFAGLRVDEILSCRVGAIRWQHHTTATAATATARVCLLDVPTNKTGTAFTKPVDPTVGDAIEAWETVRPRTAAVRGSQDRRAGRRAARLPRRADR